MKRNLLYKKAVSNMITIKSFTNFFALPRRDNKVVRKVYFALLEILI